MKYLHTMVRIKDVDASLAFYCDALALNKSDATMLRPVDSLIFLAAPGDHEAQVELTHNWDGDELGEGDRNFGHLAYAVDDIYATCARLAEHGVVINRPPRDGRMAFVRSPDNISIELLQKGEALAPAEPWASMENVGVW